MWAMELHHCQRLLIDGQRDYLAGKATGTIGNLSSLEKFYPGKALSFEQKVCQKLGLNESDPFPIYSCNLLTILFII
jgi:adenylosuccinate lyase